MPEVVMRVCLAGDDDIVRLVVSAGWAEDFIAHATLRGSVTLRARCHQIIKTTFTSNGAFYTKQLIYSAAKP